MFDIGFLEILAIGVVGLLLIGPDQLPGAIRSGAMWVGRIRRTLRNARTEIEHQIGADEIRQEIHNEEVMRRLEELKQTKSLIEQQTRDAVDSLEDEFEDEFEAHSHGPNHHHEDSNPPIVEDIHEDHPQQTSTPTENILPDVTEPKADQ